MKKFILDCSVAISRFMPDENNEDTLNILEHVAKTGAIVPSLRHLEIDNVLAEHSMRITKEQKLSVLYALYR